MRTVSAASLALITRSRAGLPALRDAFLGQGEGWHAPGAIAPPRSERRMGFQAGQRHRRLLVQHRGCRRGGEALERDLG